MIFFFGLMGILVCWFGWVPGVRNRGRGGRDGKEGAG